MPGIAKEWAVSREQKKVYVRINPEARFSDGMPITTDDVMFTFYMMQQEFLLAPWYDDFFTSILNGVTRYDEFTFAVSLPDARPDMAYKALTWEPYPKHFFKELGDGRCSLKKALGWVFCCSLYLNQFCDRV